jgi:outer membrane protein
MSRIFILLSPLVIFFSLLPSMAQAAGVAGVNITRVINEIPQKKQIENKLRKEFGGRIKAMQALEKEMKTLMQKQKNEGERMSEKQQTELQRKLEKLESEYKLKGKALTEDNRRRQIEERDKLIKIVKGAIDTVAKAEGYEAVLDLNAVAYIMPERDISGKVIAELMKIK